MTDREAGVTRQGRIARFWGDFYPPVAQRAYRLARNCGGGGLLARGLPVLDDCAGTAAQGSHVAGLRPCATRYFTGLSVEEAAEAVGLSRSTAGAHWAYARAWLHRRLKAVGVRQGAEFFSFSAGWISRRWRMELQRAREGGTP